MFLHVVGHNERFRVIDLTFRRSGETISRFFQKVLHAVGELRNELIVHPATNVHPKIHGSRKWYPYFKVGTNVQSLSEPNLLINICPVYLTNLPFHYYLGLHRSN